MANANDSPSGRHRRTSSDESGVLGTSLTTRHIEAFGRKVTTTASHLIGDPSGSVHYQHAMSELQKELRRPGIQQRVFSYAKASPTELVRKSLSTSEIQHRALTYLPDELLASIPEQESIHSLFQGFQASLPDLEDEGWPEETQRRRKIKDQRVLGDLDDRECSTPLSSLKKERHALDYRLEKMGVRKSMCSAEIREIDNKILNLNGMRQIVLDRLGDLEQNEGQMESDLLDLDNRLEDLMEEIEGTAEFSHDTTPTEIQAEDLEKSEEEETSFMSASIYEKLPSPKAKRQKSTRRKSIPIRHEHFEPGSCIKEYQAHDDMITALDFDVPFGTMVTSALDDTVRVWDLNAGRCIGLLEGHHASVRCLQVEDNILATGSMDASIRLWDLNQADYTFHEKSNLRSSKREEENEDDDAAFEGTSGEPHPPPSSSSMRDCALHTLSAHVAEVTALHFRGDTLVSGSADKTLRQWDLVKGRCVQTLDVLWAAAQASASINTDSASSSNNPNSGPIQWRKPGSRLPDASADFVGALQCFDAALACGTADGMVRLWDLRSGQVHRSLVGHTGAVTCLQFDERNLVTASADRSIRIWDLRMGSIHDAYAYDNPVTSMMFDSRRIVAAAGETVTKIYDKTDGRHWDCGAGGLDGDGERHPSVVERVRVRDGYLTEGRKDGTVGIWTC